MDFGDARCGVAISDALGITAQGLDTIAGGNMQKVAVALTLLALDNDAGEFVVGFPKNMNGTVGERGKRTQKFAKILGEVSGLPVTLWDERLTSVSAHNTLREANVRASKQKGSVDKIAAVLILQGYMAKNKNFGG